MKSICLLDTSIFAVILRVEGMSSKAEYQQTAQELEKKIQDDESLFLPMATILETGNHITQHGDGLGDVSIICDWERMRDQNKGRHRVYIWSLDQHLQGYDYRPLFK